MSSKTQYFRPSRTEDWEPYRAIIEALYKEKKLKEVMDTMETSYSFKATTRQYKIKIKEWGLDDKYIKTSEYLGILKVKRRREREDPNRDTVFWLRGKQVDPASITRFETRATKRGLITANDTLSDRGEPLIMPSSPFSSRVRCSSAATHSLRLLTDGRDPLFARLARRRPPVHDADRRLRRGNN
ncbi:hypothetical protein RB595_007983 [Gaeumannomyces hyphopodioides]